MVSVLVVVVLVVVVVVAVSVVVETAFGIEGICSGVKKVLKEDVKVAIMMIPVAGSMAAEEPTLSLSDVGLR